MAGGAGGEVSGYLPTQIALRAQSLQTGARQFNRVVIGASQGDGFWRANVEAEQFGQDDSPDLLVLGQGDPVVAPAIFWGSLLGSILVTAYTSTGMLVSFWSNNNRTSYLVSLGIFILILVPSQLPGRAQTGAAGQFLQQLNPLAAQNHFLSKILVNNGQPVEYGQPLFVIG